MITRTRRLFPLALALTIAAAATAIAQVRPQMPAMPAKPAAPVMPDNAAIDSMMRQQQQRAPIDLESASRQIGPAGAPRGGLAMPPIDANSGQVDIEKLARMYSDMKTQPASEDAPNLIVFVSLSIPEATLLRIGQQAAKANAVVAVRGFRYGLGKGMDKSMKALQPLIETGADVQVHPELFDRYNVKVVPTVVVASDPEPGCTQDACASKSVAVRGDASLDYILDRVAQRRDPVGQLAKERLKLLMPR